MCQTGSVRDQAYGRVAFPRLCGPQVLQQRRTTTNQTHIRTPDVSTTTPTDDQATTTTNDDSHRLPTIATTTLTTTYQRHVQTPPRHAPTCPYTQSHTTASYYVQDDIGLGLFPTFSQPLVATAPRGQHWVVCLPQLRGTHPSAIPLGKHVPRGSCQGNSTASLVTGVGSRTPAQKGHLPEKRR